MISSALFTLALAASSVTAFPRAHRSNINHRSIDIKNVARGEDGVKPIDWWVGLEEYHGYHIRYMAISCYTQHNTTFFDDCCHPMIKSETLATDRKPYCAPSAQASSSASAVEPSRSVVLVTNVPAGMTSAPVASATASAAAEDDEDCEEEEEEEDDEDCEDEDESSAAPASSTPAPSSSKVASSTHVSSARFTTSRVAASTSTKVAATPAKNVAVEASSTPVPTSTKAAEPTTSSTATTTTSSKAAASTTASSSSGLVTGGRATFYSQLDSNKQEVAGACGDKHSDADHIVAIAFSSYGDTGKKSPLCGKTVQITNKNNGKTLTATVADACEGCSTQSLDMSSGLFAAFGATESDGVFPIEWKYL